jgi:hypothetical protein
MNLENPCVVAGFVSAGVAFVIWQFFFQKCRKCGGRLRLDGTRDPLGVNLTRKITVSIFSTRRRYTHTWKCRTCGHLEEREETQ